MERVYEQMAPRTEWGQHSYHNAVDSDPNTCWDTLKAPKKGDYFGLMLVGSLNADTLTLHTADEISRPEKQFMVSVLEENRWVNCKASSTENNYAGRIQLAIDCPVRHYRLIKVTFKNDLSVPFKLCSLSLENFAV
ncbi:hypothetical protein G6F56_012836 [Rhizopus delemar]|nr:hypothetical protein G6F56_012836 [Rhizopus delemar]